MEETKPEVTIDTIRQSAIDFIDIIGYAVDIHVSQDKDNSFLVELTGDNLGVLIGFHGKNISSIEYILNLILSRKYGNKHYISLDINGYISARHATIKRYVESAIKRLLETHSTQDLYPMPASERLFVHNLVKENPELDTESVGEEPNRYITIKFKGLVD